jgi:RND family efflux transporter MFP subunit
VPERFAADIRPGSRATVTFDALDAQTFQASVAFVGASVNPSNRTFPVELRLPNPGRAVKPAMVASISVVRRTVEDAVVVPQDALVRVEDGYSAFVVTGTGDELRVEARRVTTGPSQRNEVVITSGLEAGDRLVVVGQKQVAAGDLVRVVGEG